MSQNIRPAQRMSAGQRLASLYGQWFIPGRAETTQLRFSPNPRKWHITAEPLPGLRQPDGIYSMCRVAITATLPRQWITRKIEPQTIHGKRALVAGETAVAAPPGTAAKTSLIAFSIQYGESQLRLHPCWAFRIREHGVEGICGASLTPPADIPKAAAEAYQTDFRPLLAAKVARRMLPERKFVFADETDKWAERWSPSVKPIIIPRRHR